MRTETAIQLSRPLVEVRLEDADALPGAAPVEAVERQAKQLDAEINQRAQEEQVRLAAEREGIERVLASMTEAAHNFDSRKRQLLAEMQQVAIELAVAVAGHLVHEKIQASEFPIENVVRQVVEHLGAKQPVKVRLHPDDLALLAQRLGDSPLATSAADVELVPDATLSRGDCRAEAGEVSMLSQLDVQLADLRRHLLGSLGHAEIERRKAQTGDRGLRRFPDRRQTA